MMHDWGMMNWGWGGMIFQLLFWVVLIGVIIWGVKYITGHSRNTGRELHDEDSALRILRERYARGEIDREEFEAKKRDLSS